VSSCVSDLLVEMSAVGIQNLTGSGFFYFLLSNISHMVYVQRSLIYARFIEYLNPTENLRSRTKDGLNFARVFALQWMIAKDDTNWTERDFCEKEVLENVLFRYVSIQLTNRALEILKTRLVIAMHWQLCAAFWFIMQVLTFSTHPMFWIWSSECLLCLEGGLFR
jgi:hypothetical protein